LEKYIRELEKKNYNLEKQISELNSENKVLKNELELIKQSIDTKLLKIMITCNEWKEQKKVERLEAILAAEEELKKKLSNKSDLTKCMNFKRKVNELFFIHKEINKQIMSASKKKEKEELIKKRENNLKELNETLNVFIAQLKIEVQNLDKDCVILKNYVDSRNGTDVSVDRSSISDTMYQELIRNKKQFEEGLQDLMHKVDMYMKNLEKRRQKINSTMKEETEKEIQDKKKQKELLGSVIESYNGIKRNMKSFAENSDQVSTLIKQYLEMEDKISDLEDDIKELEVGYSKKRKAMLKEDDDEKREKTEKDMQRILADKKQKEKELSTVRIELSKLKKTLSSFCEFGEVSKLLLPKKNGNVSLADYELIKYLGGRNHNIGLYKNMYGEQVVLKKFFIGQDYSKLRRQEELLMNLPKNPLILPINRIFYKDELAYVEMPYIEGGTLREWMKTKKSVREIQNMIRLIAQGISFLHNQDIIHCDLKPENILIRNLNETAIPVLCDFEFSRNRNTVSTNTTIGGTYNYMSPELLNGRGKPSVAADVWAFGIIMLELFCNGTPLHIALDQNTDPIRINANALMNDVKSEHTLIELLQNVLKKNPSERYDMDQVLNQEFMLKVLNESNIEEKKSRIKVFKQHISLRSNETYK
jgi:serine/threonine protein kinase